MKKEYFIVSIIFFGISTYLLPFASAGVYSGGNGSPQTPYLIVDAADIIELSNMPSDWNKCFLMVADINMVDHTFTTAVIAPDKTNTSEKYDGTGFSGVFDGGGHTIENLTINTMGVGNDYLGLFGRIETNGVLKNIYLQNSHIVGTSESFYMGVLCASNSCGIVSNCHVSGEISGYKYIGGLIGSSSYGIILNCSASVNVSAISYCIGGLVGYHNFGSISSCYAHGNIEAERIVGGLVGINNQASISNSYALGSVTGYMAGGLVGDNSGSILNCYAASDVSGNDSAGLAGSTSSSISNSFWDTEIQTHGVTESVFQGSWIPLKNVKGLTTAQLQEQSVLVDNGWDFVGEISNGTCQTWQMPSIKGYPVLSIMSGYTPPILEGTGTEGDPYLIHDPNELGAVVYYNITDHFRLVADINLQDIQWSVPVIPVFNGGFDGNGHKILSLSITGSGHLGFLGFVRNESKISNLNIEFASVHGAFEYGTYIGGLISYNWGGDIFKCNIKYNVCGLRYLGGLIGYNNGGRISNCHSVGSVDGGSYTNSGIGFGGLVGYNINGSIIDSETTSFITSGTSCEKMGGLCGYNEYGTIYNSQANSTVVGNKSCFNMGGLVGYNLYGSVIRCSATCNVTGTEYNIGGLIGCNRGSVSYCYAIGTVNGGGAGGLVGGNDYDSSVSNSYYIGDVNGGGDVGGLVGGLYSGTISNCYSIGNVNGTGFSIGGLVGDVWKKSSISNCYSACNVSGGRGQIGGLAGISQGSISNCFWNNEIQTHGISVGIGENFGTATNVEGLTTFELYTQNTFTNSAWDFVGESNNGNNDIWRMCVDGVNYPRLSWEYAKNGDFACGDGADLLDLQVLAEHWLFNKETYPVNFSYACDANSDGVIDMADFEVLTVYWMEN